MLPELLVIHISILAVNRCRGAPVPNTVVVDIMYQLEYVQNVTFLLDNLLKGYDKSIRPNSPAAVREPTFVDIDISVRSMGPVSEVEMAFSLDCYFRQTWRDERLRYTSATQETLSLGVAMLDKIWKPDTYFWNGKDSYLHLLTMPNKFVRLSKDGTVHFSSRLTIKAKCPMNIHRFPLDQQRCPLLIGSFAYRTDELIYRWKKDHNGSVSVSDDMRLSSFSLDSITLFNETRQRKHGMYSVLEVNFVLHRHAGYFLINFYGPCTLIVILSWVAFWINREATADRIALGVTSMLTMTFLFLDSRSDLPRVTYPTALDIYLILCFSFVMGTILEFSFVHGFTKYGTGDPELAYIERERIAKQRTAVKKLINDPRVDKRTKAKLSLKILKQPKEWLFQNQSSRRETGPGAGDRERKPLHSAMSLPANMRGLGDPPCYQPKKPKLIRWYTSWSLKGKKMDPSDTTINSVSQVDRAARMLFPLAFAIASALYWRILLNYDYGEGNKQ